MRSDGLIVGNWSPVWLQVGGFHAGADHRLGLWSVLR